MSRLPGDDTSTTDSSLSGGIANVFRGLASSKSTKSPPAAASSSLASLAIPPGELSAASHRLSPSHMEAYEQLKHGTLNERIAAANSLKFAITEYPLNPVLDIWYAGKDLIEATQIPQARTAGWELLSECVKHASSTDLERREYFQTLSAPANPDDFHLQLAATSDLTSSGRVLSGFDYDLLPLLTRWLQETYNAVRQARRSQPSRSKSSHRGRAAVSGVEKNFDSLFALLTDVIKFSFNNADETAVAGLLDCLLGICKSTSVADDLKASIALIDAIVTFGTIPSHKLEACVLVLSSILCVVTALAKDAWRTLSHLCRSHYGQAIVRLLLDLLRNVSAKEAMEPERGRDIKGALTVLQKLLTKTSEKGYPTVPYALLVDGLSNAAMTASSVKVQAVVLKIIATLFGDGDGPTHSSMVDEDWSAALDVAAACFAKLDLEADAAAHAQMKEEQTVDTAGTELRQLVTRLEVLVSRSTGDFIPRQSIIDFFILVHPLLPDSAVRTLLDYFHEFRCCSPSDLDWEKNLELVLDGFFRNRKRESSTRLRALSTIMDAYEVVDLVGDDSGQDFIPRLAKSVLQDAAEESDTDVLEAVMRLMVTVAVSCGMELFDYINGTLRTIVMSDGLKSPIAPATLPRSASPAVLERQYQPREQSPSNVVTKASVRMFLQTMNSDSIKAAKLYSSLVSIARASHCEVDARLTAMKLLFRIRSDWANRVFVTADLDTSYLATTLCRTEDSLLRKQNEESTHQLRTSRSEHAATTRPTRGVSFSQNSIHDRGIPVRSASGPKPPQTKYIHMWKLPDPAALPEVPPVQISPVLLSREIVSDTTDSESTETLEDAATSVINSASWLEAILSILRGSDWEVYSFVLVHLPSQLSNHTIFQKAVPQIQELRRLLCENIRLNGFQEPPSASGLWRADVAICIFHSLTMLVSYHEHFQKGEEDEMVKTFGMGITHWERTANGCIHALAMCCHELPLSVSKIVVQFLNQMATIITQPTVAIHILEFLASLSRIPNVYVNFIEEEYKTIFGICFRYLDYTRDKRRSNRSSHTADSATLATPTNQSVETFRPSASDDLPQYVYALAYHVLIFWFLALKLPDRASYVGWISKRLFAEADGPGQAADDYALTTMDFMQRVAYADVDESAEDANFTEDRFGEIMKRRWLIGNSIVTVKQATVSGWAQIVKRQPSGISAYLIRETFQPPPTHQAQSYVDISREGQSTNNNILPSHLLVQVMSPLPQSWDGTRPIPLPSDDATERAIRVLDKSSTVDGHKVGVVYIGEGQTHETEILANVSGSSDYAEFLNGLGTLTRLKGAKFNTQGLDREHGSDGEFTFCWRDRVTEIVFHVTTQMPTNIDRDPQLAQKKKHIGNDFVNIIFNDSARPFNFDTFPSQFNYVNVVITPASRASFIATREAAKKSKGGNPVSQPFYNVQVMSKPGFPEISPASETKLVSLHALPVFIRLIALNASVFCLVWENRHGGEHVSSWRSRLKEIKRLREKYGPKIAPATATSPQPTTLGGNTALAQPQAPAQQQQQPQQQQQAEASRPSSSVRDSLTSLRRTSVATFFTSTSEQTSHRSSTLSASATTNDTETAATSALDALVDSVDFSKWA